MRTRIQKWGNSLALRIPKAYAVEAEIKPGVIVDLTREADKLIISVPHETKITLDELLARVTKKNIHNEIDYGASQGKEIW